MFLFKNRNFPYAQKYDFPCNTFSKVRGARVHGANVFYFLFLSKAHGFEILCSKNGQSTSEQETPVSSNPLWRGFLDSLKKNGYFKVGKSFCVEIS